jgi:hypothetical protein
MGVQWRRQRVGTSQMKAECAPGSVAGRRHGGTDAVDARRLRCSIGALRRLPCGKLRSAAAISLTVRTAEAEDSVHPAAGADVGGQLRRRVELGRLGDGTRSLRTAFVNGAVRRDGYHCRPERPGTAKGRRP